MSTIKRVVIIDDQDHALKQTIFEFPGIDKSKISFQHFKTIRAFRDAKLGRVYLVLLDFFLSKDREYGTVIIPELECDHLICFSSMKQMPDSMYRTALDVERTRIGKVYSVQKIKDSYANKRLKEVLNSIFNAEEMTDNVKGDKQ
jgi:hypothetical protein